MKLMKLKSLQLTAVIVASGLALAGCAGENVAEPALTAQKPEATTEAQEQTETTTSEAPETDGETRQAAMDTAPAADGFSTEPTEKFGDGHGELRTTDIRVGSHDGFDRLVIEFEGTGDPSYHIGYNDDPRQDGSGFPIDAPGDAKLEMFVHGTSLDMSTDAKYAPNTNLGLATGNIVDVHNGGVFEGASQYVVGLNSELPYKVEILHEPTRLVVDFQN